jgi:hypothetical protein
MELGEAPLPTEFSLGDLETTPLRELSISLKTRRKLLKLGPFVDQDTNSSQNWIQEAQSADLSGLLTSPDISLQDSLVFLNVSFSPRNRARTAASRLLTPVASELQKAMDALENQAVLTLKQLEKALDSLEEELKAEHNLLFQQTLRDIHLLTPKKESKGSWKSFFVCSHKSKKDPPADLPTTASFLSFLSASTAATANDVRKSHLFLKAYQITADLVFGSMSPADSDGISDQPVRDVEAKMGYFFHHRRLASDFEIVDFGGIDLLSMLSISRFVLNNQPFIRSLWASIRQKTSGREPLGYLLDFARLFYPESSKSGGALLNSSVNDGFRGYLTRFELSFWTHLGDIKGHRPSPPISLQVSQPAVETALRKVLTRKEPLQPSERTAILRILS